MSESKTNPYREPATQSGACTHERLLNRGCPPNESNQRVCAGCGKTFHPSNDPMGTLPYPPLTERN